MLSLLTGVLCRKPWVLGAKEGSTCFSLSWQPLECELVKINVDAGFMSDSGLASAAVVTIHPRRQLYFFLDPFSLDNRSCCLEVWGYFHVES
ncbi:hypothetical protein V6N13_009276 [Hibiscus sabdariffa]